MHVTAAKRIDAIHTMDRTDPQVRAYSANVIAFTEFDYNGHARARADTRVFARTRVCPYIV